MSPVAVNTATRVTVSAFGVLAGLAGVEHGIGEVRQGRGAPPGLVIQSWPEAEAFRILNGEPALTIVPDLLITGSLAIIASLVFLVWVAVYIDRRRGGLVLLLISIVMLFVGAGFGPPLLGVILSAAASRINAPLDWWRRHLGRGVRSILAGLWPWALGAGLVAWLLLMPGTVIVSSFVADDADAALAVAVSFLILAAFGLLGLTILAGFARDIERRTSRPSMSVVSR